MKLQGEKLLFRIEILRRQLNKSINNSEKTPKSCPNTYKISLELDELINQYMRACQGTHEK